MDVRENGDWFFRHTLYFVPWTIFGSSILVVYEKEIIVFLFIFQTLSMYVFSIKPCRYPKYS